MTENESPYYMLSYMSVIKMSLLSLVVLHILKKSTYLTKVKGHGIKRKLIYDFLYVCNTNGVSLIIFSISKKLRKSTQ